LKKTAMVGGSILAGAAFYFFIIAPKGKLGWLKILKLI
jgi:hypothetical protein